MVIREWLCVCGCMRFHIDIVPSSSSHTHTQTHTDTNRYVSYHRNAAYVFTFTAAHMVDYARCKCDRNNILQACECLFGIQSIGIGHLCVHAMAMDLCNGYGMRLCCVCMSACHMPWTILFTFVALFSSPFRHANSETEEWQKRKLPANHDKFRSILMELHAFLWNREYAFNRGRERNGGCDFCRYLTLYMACDVRYPLCIRQVCIEIVHAILEEPVSHVMPEQTFICINSDVSSVSYWMPMAMNPHDKVAFKPHFINSLYCLLAGRAQH